MKKIVSLLILFVIFQFLYSQPSWINDLPQSNDFIYYRGVGSDIVIEKAKGKAISNALKDICLRNVDVSIKTKLINEIKEVISNNKSNFKENTEYNKIIEMDGKTDKVRLRVEEAYFINKGNNFTYWVLLREPKNPSIPNNYNASQSYGFAPIWRSIVIPGWGQFYKKQEFKGYTFLFSEVLLLTTTGIFLLSEKYNRNEGATSISMSVREDYYDKADDAKKHCYFTWLSCHRHIYL